MQPDSSPASPRPWCECDPDYDGRCPYPCQIDADEKREAASAASAASSRASAEQIVEASSAAYSSDALTTVHRPGTIRVTMIGGRPK